MKTSMESSDDEMDTDDDLNQLEDEAESAVSAQYGGRDADEDEYPSRTMDRDQQELCSAAGQRQVLNELRVHVNVYTQMPRI